MIANQTCIKCVNVASQKRYIDDVAYNGNKIIGDVTDYRCTAANDVNVFFDNAQECDDYKEQYSRNK